MVTIIYLFSDMDTVMLINSFSLWSRWLVFVGNLLHTCHLRHPLMNKFRKILIVFYNLALSP